MPPGFHVTQEVKFTRGCERKLKNHKKKKNNCENCGRQEGRKAKRRKKKKSEEERRTWRKRSEVCGGMEEKKTDHFSQKRREKPKQKHWVAARKQTTGKRKIKNRVGGTHYRLDLTIRCYDLYTSNKTTNSTPSPNSKNGNKNQAKTNS